ncbi:MAG: hypothetical protein U0176_21025 [Bacteroidia bacterium]
METHTAANMDTIAVFWNINRIIQREDKTSYLSDQLQCHHRTVPNLWFFNHSDHQQPIVQFKLLLNPLSSN